MFFINVLMCIECAARPNWIRVWTAAQCKNDEVFCLCVSAGLRHPGESPAPVQRPPHSDACLLHCGLLPHPRGGAHHPHVHLLRQGEWWMRRMQRERENRKRAKHGSELGDPLRRLQKLPRLNVPSPSIRGAVIEEGSSWKLKDH